MKILIIALSGIGDALLFTPALKLLKETYPESQIDILVMFKGAKEIFERNKEISNVLHFNFLKKGYLASLLYLIKMRNKYDITINVYPSNRIEYNVISFLLGAKKRAAVKYLRNDKENFGRLNNVRILEDDSFHNVKTNIKLVEKLSGKSFIEEPPLELNLTKDDIEFADNYLIKNNINSGDLVIGFHPGSAVFKNHIKRRWEPAKFIELGRKLVEKDNAKIMIFGGPDEDELKNKISSAINSESVFFIASPNLPSTAALMKRCNIFVTNDSSLMHVSSALNLKVVAIIGPTNPAYIHPWKTEYKIVTLNLECSPCFVYSQRPLICFRDDIKFKCIKELTVEMVYDAVKSFIKKI